MTPTTTLSEPSFQDLIAAVEQAGELSDQRRRHWLCSLRHIANGLDRPARVIPARWLSVRASVSQLHHARVGVTAKTLANHKSNVRAALRWFSKEHDVPRQGARLSADWAGFRDTLDKLVRYRLYHFIRYCSAHGIAPSAVSDEIFADYWRYRSATSGRACENDVRRGLVRAWNARAAAVGASLLPRLTEPPIKKIEPAWDDFPEGLRHDIDEYLSGCE